LCVNRHTRLKNPRFDRTDEGMDDLEEISICSVFVDHFSDFTYVHLLKAQDGDEVLAAKATFEATADSMGS
jgi:hypothetical protein